MKNVFKRNQVMITALAIMIAVAGYLNFAGTRIQDEDLVRTDAAVSEDEMTMLLDLSDEDIAGEIPGLEDDGDAIVSENFLDTDMQVADQASLSVVSDYIDEGMAEELQEDAVMSQDAEVQDGETPGEAVYTSSSAMSSLAGARLLKEQTRARNKETLLEIINNANISESQKQEAVDNMIAMTDMAERETSAEVMLEAKGFSDAVVTITGDCADVVVAETSLTDIQCAPQDGRDGGEYRDQSLLRGVRTAASENPCQNRKNVVDWLQFLRDDRMRYGG